MYILSSFSRKKLTKYFFEDKRHHATDVVVGIIIGFADGILIMIFVADIFNTPRAFQEKSASEVDYDYESVADQSFANNIMDLDQVDHGSTVSNNRNIFKK